MKKSVDYGMMIFMLVIQAILLYIGSFFTDISALKGNNLLYLLADIFLVYVFFSFIIRIKFLKKVLIHNYLQISYFIASLWIIYQIYAYGDSIISSSLNVLSYFLLVVTLSMLIDDIDKQDKEMDNRSWRDRLER